MAEQVGVPPKVEAAAAKANMGSLVISRPGSNPLGNFLMFIGVAVALLIGSGVLLWLISIDVNIEGALVILLALGAVVCVFFAFYSLTKGFTALYIFQRGLIATRNGRVQTARFDEIDELQEWQGSGITEGKKLFYRIRFFDGRHWDVETQASKDQSTALVENLMGVVRFVGRPLVVRPRPGLTAPPGSEPSKIFIFAMLAAIAGVSVGLYLLGIPGWVSATAGFLVVGGVLRFVGIRTTSPVTRVLGSLFLVTAGLVFLGVTIPLLHPVNGWITTAFTVIFEVAVVKLVQQGYWRVAHRFGGFARKLYAGRHGWTFTGTTAVDVPGPNTAVRLCAVPNPANQTQGQATMRRTVDGVEVTVFDRARRHKRSDDRPQTVWYVQAPIRAPFLLPAQLGYPEQSSWWIDGGYLIQTADGRGAAGTRVKQVEARAAELVRLAQSLDWARVQFVASQPRPAMPVQPRPADQSNQVSGTT